MCQARSSNAESRFYAAHFEAYEYLSAALFYTSAALPNKSDEGGHVPRMHHRASFSLSFSLSHFISHFLLLFFLISLFLYFSYLVASKTTRIYYETSPDTITLYYITDIVPLLEKKTERKEKDCFFLFFFLSSRIKHPIVKVNITAASIHISHATKRLSSDHLSKGDLLIT